MDQQNRNIVEKVISSRKAQRRIKRIIALMAVFVLLMTTDSLKLLADTMESDAALDAVNVIEAVDAEQLLFDESEPALVEEAAPEWVEDPDAEVVEAEYAEDGAIEDEAFEDVSVADDGADAADNEAVSLDDTVALEGDGMAAEELADVSIDEVFAGDADSELFLDYEEPEDVLYAVSSDGAGFHAEVSGDTGVTLPAGTTLAAQWTENIQGRSGAVAQLCEALGVEGNAFPANMGAAFMDMALLNGGATIQPAGNVYVNIDFTDPLRVEGREPIFRVVTLVDGVARVIDDASYGVTLDGNDVTGIWFCTDLVGETALVWDVLPETEAEAVEEIPEADGAEPADGDEAEEAQIEEITETVEEATDETEGEETQPADETETDETETDETETDENETDETETEAGETENDETEDEAEITDETEADDEGEEETQSDDAPEAEDETGDEAEDETEEEAETEPADETEAEAEVEDEPEDNTGDEPEAETEDNTETESEDEPDEAAAVTVTGYANGINITVAGDVPAGAVPMANLLAGGEKYDAFVEAIAALTDDETARHALAFDIALTYNNEETQPNGPADVTVAFDAPFAVSTGDELFRLVRFQDGVAEWVDVAELDIENGVLKGFAFTADALAPVAVVSGAEDVLYAEPAIDEPEADADEPEEDAGEEAAAEPLRLGIATVTTAEGEGLPADAQGHAEIIDGEDAIASVQAFLNGGRRAKKAAARAEMPESETRYTVLDIDVSNADAEGYRVDVTLPEAIEAHDFRLFHIHDDVEEIEVTLYDAEGNAVDPAATSAVTGFSFITASFSPFVLQYTVDITYEDDIRKITLAFDGFSAEDAGVDADSVIRLLNDGVSVNFGALLSEDAQGATRSLIVDGQPADGEVADYAAYEMTETSGGVSFADGSLRITGDGSVTLTDGEDTVMVEVTGYTALLADVVEGAGVSIDVLEGAVPAGSTASYVEHTGDETAELVAAYLSAEDASAEDGQGAEEAEPGQESLQATGYAAFDVSILQPEGDLYTDQGSYQVTVQPELDIDGLVPEGAEVTNVRYAVYHIHDGEASEVPATVEDGAVTFTTDSFSDFIIEYTVEYAFADDRFDLTLNFTGFNAAAATIDGAAVIAALDEGLSLDLAKLLETAEPAEEGETLQSRYQGLTLDVPTDDYQNIDFASLSQVSAEGGVSYADGRLTIVDDGAIELTDGAYTLRLTVTGYADIVWQIRTLVAEGVTIEVLEGDVPETAEASYAPHTAEETAELAETYGIEGAGLAGFDVKILDGEEAYAEPGEYRVTVTPELDLAAQVPAGAEATDVHYVLYHIHDGEAAEVPAEVNEDGALVFTTDSFSDFIVSYTVDFHYAVDGETYEYELTGGGALSLRALVEALRVLDVEAETAEPVEDAEAAEPAETEEAEPADAEVEAVAPDYDAFVANIESVTFSDEALVKPVPVTEDATAGELKAQYALEPEYSAELTEEQIAELDAQTYTAPDWALVSLKPFVTDEALTVTMKDGEAFAIHVTDAQIKKTVIDAKGDAWEITVTYGDDAQIPDGAELRVEEILPGDERYDTYYQQASEVALGDAESQGLLEPVVAGARLFDIEIRSGEEKIEPAAPVQVDIRLVGAEADLLSVVHFAEEGPEAMALTSAGTAEEAPEAAEEEAAEPAEPVEEAGEEAEEEEAEPTIVSEISFKAQAFSVYTVVNVNNNTDIVTGGPWALVSGIAGDPGATTGYQENWGRDYFTIIVNANAMSDQPVKNGNDNVAFEAEGVHAWTDGTKSYVGGEVPEVWEFEPVPNSNDRYYIKIAGTNQYIDHHYNGQYGHDQGTCSLSTQYRSEFTIERNSDGTISIRNANNNSWYLCNNGSGEWGSRDFRFQQNVGGQDRAKFRLCKSSSDFDSFAAQKKAVKDLSSSDSFIIYRKFVDEDGNEQLYALASDGTFVRVYDGGDTVYWRETDKNIYWNYLKDGTYYGIFSTNPATNETVFLNPMHSTQQTITTEASRLTLIGKDSGEYGTTIENWDQTSYDYAGLHVTLNNGEPTLGTGTRVAGTSDEFLFAVVSTMPGATAETVETVDSDSLGIKITMFDYGDWDGNYNAGDKLSEMTNIAGSAEYTPHAAHALVKPYLEEGVPSGTSSGAMTGLFTSGGAIKSSKSGVNHLFLQSYYDENGMFRYRSEDNYAYLPFSDGQITGTDFTVYRQAATPYTTDTAPGHTYYYHGHYMPFNDIDMDQHVGRLMNQYGNEYTNGNIVGELPIGDGRTYEEIYGTQGIPNFYTGMKMEATFIQPRDGTLENGDDMVFKFTGDDDMWVYIDGVLVLDIGGIHEPLSGTINFATGEVTNPTGSSLAGTSNLKTILTNALNTLTAILENQRTDEQKAQIAKLESIQWNGNTFADYSTHDFKAFYMERGAGASNLDLQFNLKVVKSNELTVEKELLPPGIDYRFINQTFRYRATYIDEYNGVEKPLYHYVDGNNQVHASVDSQGNPVCTEVYYKGRTDAQGKPIKVPVPIDDQGYFTLKPGEGAIFVMKDDEVEYKVREVNVDTDLVSRVDINEIDDVTIKTDATDDNYVEAGKARVAYRNNVVYRNWPYLANLRITKHIIEDSLDYDQDNPPVFEFRVYLETTETVTNPNGTTQEVHKLVPYSYGPYYLVTIPEGAENNESAWTYYKLTGEGNKPVAQSEKVICSTTGRSGSINSIPPEYTIIIPNLGLGTHFYVEERRDNIPGGYEFDHEELREGTYDPETLYTSAEYEQNHDTVIERILARDEEDHQEFDPSTIGKIKYREGGVSTDAWTDIYNRRPKVDIPVEKKWNPTPAPGDPAPSPVPMVLVRYKGPEHTHKPAYGKGAIHINHRYAKYVDGDNVTNGSMPSDFVAEYTIYDANGDVVVGPTTSRGPFDLDAGTYTVHTVVRRPLEYNGYNYDTTPDVTEVTVVSDKTTEIEVQSRYVNPDEQKGYITISHVSSGLPTTDLPEGFEAYYLICPVGGDPVEDARIFYSPVVKYPVEPGEYTVTLAYSTQGGAAPEGYRYLGTGPEEYTLTVGGGETKVAAFTSTYQLQQAQQGTLVINHVSSGLNGTALPNGFQVTYTVAGQNGHNYTFNEAGSHTVAPDTYTVTANVGNNGSAPSGYTYTGTTPNPVNNVSVSNGGTGTASFTSTYTQQQAQTGKIAINHVSSGIQGTTALPSGFNATYTVTGPETFSGTKAEVESHAFAPGNYSVSVNVSNGAAPSGYTYDTTTPNTVNNVSVSNGGTGTASFTSTYTQQQAAQNTITINHVSSGLPSSPALPDGFNATYTIVKQTGNVTVYDRVPMGTYSVDPGDNYLVTTTVSYAATPDDYDYVSTNNTDQPIYIYVGQGERKTADFTSEYKVAPNTVDVLVQVGGYQFDTINTTYQVPRGGTLTLTVTSVVQPNAKTWLPPFNQNGYYSGSTNLEPTTYNGNAYVYTLDNIRSPIAIGVLNGNNQSPTASVSINGVTVAAAPARHDFVFNPFVAYADEPDNEGEVSIAPLSAPIQEKVYAAVGANVEPGYTLDTAFGQRVMLSETIDWDHVFKDLPELDEYGNVYYYALVELDVPEDYTVSYGNSPISAELIRENMEARADDNNQNQPELLTLTATNTMKTGNLKLVKVIAPGSNQDTTVRFYFKVTLTGADPSRLLLDGEEIDTADAVKRISTDESTGETTIIVEFIGDGTHTLSGVLLGTTYEVVELNAQNNQGYTTYTMPAHWQQKGSVSITSDVDGGANKTIAADETETATITNEETADVPATKTWAPNNPGNVTIYFKLYYQRTVTPETGDPYTETIAVPNQPMQAIAGNDDEITVSWSDLPKYMDDGTAYTYVVKEFIQSDGGEYVENDIHYTEAAPDGYVKVENGLSITNTKSEEYNPKTNYTGTKTWVDPNKSVRPDSLHVTLMIDDGDGNPDNDQPATYVENGVTKRYEAQWTKGEGELSDEWFYTFHNLPVFDEYGNAIDYYVVEAPANGYSQTSTNINKKEYIRLTEKYIENIPTSGASYYDYPLTLQHETDLPFVAIRENDSHADRYGNAYTFHVWTPRQLTDDDERRAVIAAINGNLQSLGVGQADLANLNNTRFVTGQPTGDPTVEVEGHPGSHKVDFMYWEGQPVGQGYRVEIHQSGEKTFLLSFYGRRYFQNICLGYLNYSYTPGTTDITNTQVPTTFDALKTWGNGVTPPEGSVIKIVLKASTSAGEITNLADAEHGIGIAAEYQTITLNGKVDVDTVTDETTQELLSGTQNTAKSFEDSAWHAHWADLPEYDKQGRKITYSVKEISYAIGETTVNIGEGGFPPTYTAATDSAPYTVTNQIPTTKKSAKKLWNENQGATLPEGVKVTLTLSAKEKGGDGQPIELSALNVSPASVVLDGIVSEETGEVETAATLWAYTWNNLPEYYNGKEVEYTVAETGYEIGGVQYPTVEPNETNPEGYANFDHTFTNKLPTVVVEATKIWENHLGEDITDQIKNVQVEFELQELTPPAEPGGEEKWLKVDKDADGQNITNPVQRDGSETPAWKASWTNLPKYRDGELIQYRVKETYAWVETDSQSGSIALTPAEPVVVVFPVVDPDGDDNPPVNPDTGTASIINQLPPIDVAVYKAWDSIDDNWPDSRISVRMKLMKEGEQEQPVPLENTIVQYDHETPQAGEAQYGYVTLTADATRKEWKNLPRYYDTGELIKYVVVEDGVFFTPEDGEPIEIDIDDYFDITITNEIDSNDNWFFTVDNKPKKTEIKVTKVWTLNNEPITNKPEVSYTLKRVYGQVDETVETYRAIANVGEVEFSKIKYVVDETTEQGAWQIITIPELPLFHMNVDATANPPVTFVPVTYYVEESREGLEETTVVTYSAESEADPSNDTPDDPSNDTPDEKLNARAAAIDHGTITIYNRDKTGSLTVTKALSGNAAETAKEFSFKVVFTNELLRAGKAVGTWKKGNDENIEEATSESISFSSEGENAGKAEITFTLKGGERAEFTGLPEGTTFTVTEVSADQDGYETTVKVDGQASETKTVTGTISSAATVTVDYTNTRNTTEAEAVKEWKYDDEDAVWPETVKSVTFKLFKTVNGNKTEVTAEDMFDATGFDNPLTVTADTEDHKAVWKNLPTKYWLDAVEGVEGVEADPENGIEAVEPVEAVEAGWYDATYTVEEIGITYTDDTLTEVNGNITADGNYLVTYSEDGKTIINTYNRTYVDLEKKWRENDQDVTASTAETQISARLYRTNGELVEVGPNGTTWVVTEGETSPYSARVFQKRVDNVDNNDWKWRINNLPRYYWVTGDDGKSVRKEYHYYFKEEPIYGWNVNPWYEATQPEVEGDDSGEPGDGEPGDGEPGDDSETPAVTPVPNTQANAAQVTGGGQVTITNNRFTVKLPSTGGAGTNALYATGAGLLILAAIWFIWDQRRRYTAGM